VDKDFKPGPESSDVKLFAEEEIPWDEIAFTVISKTLTNYYTDRRGGAFPFHIGDILPKIYSATPNY
jgi:hypothetical protein